MVISYEIKFTMEITGVDKDFDKNKELVQNSANSSG